MTRLACGQPDWNHSVRYCGPECSEWPANDDDESDAIDCAPTENRVPRDPTILELAARLNTASNRYHEAAQSRRMGFSDRLARVDKLVAAADELTTAIADAVAAGDGRLT